MFTGAKKTIAMAIVSLLLFSQVYSLPIATISGSVQSNVSGTLYNAPSGTLVEVYINNETTLRTEASSETGINLTQSNSYMVKPQYNAGEDFTGQNVTYNFYVNKIFGNNLTNLPGVYIHVITVQCGALPCIGSKVDVTLNMSNTTGTFQQVINLPMAQITIDSGSYNLTGQNITISEYIYNTSSVEMSPPDTNLMNSNYGLGDNQKYAGRFTVVEVNPALQQNISWVEMKMYYTDSLLDLNGNNKISDVGDLRESSLSLYWYDNSSGTWKRLDASGAVTRNYTSLGGPYVNAGSGVNATDQAHMGINYSGYIWANLTHFSVYGIGGNIITPPVTGGGGGVYMPVVRVEPGIKEITLDMVTDMIYENKLQTRAYYSVPVTLASTVGSIGNIPVPSEVVQQVSKVVFRSPVELAGDVYDRASSLVSSQSRNRVIIARGDIGVDSLASLMLGKILRAPVLLTRTDSLPGTTVSKLDRLSPREIIIVGGEKAVSREVGDKLRERGEVKRLWGDTRYETAVQVANYTLEQKKIDNLVITDGENPSVLASFVSVVYNAPVIYVKGDEVPESTSSFLESNRFVSVYYVGVSDTAQKELNKILSYLPLKE